MFVFHWKPNFENKTVLDFGCGYGTLSVEIAESGAKKVLGIDLEEKNIEFAEKTNEAKIAANTNQNVFEAEVDKNITDAKTDENIKRSKNYSTRSREQITCF